MSSNGSQNGRVMINGTLPADVANGHAAAFATEIGEGFEQKLQNLVPSDAGERAVEVDIGFNGFIMSFGGQQALMNAAELLHIGSFGFERGLAGDFGFDGSAGFAQLA